MSHKRTLLAPLVGSMMVLLFISCTAEPAQLHRPYETYDTHYNNQRNQARWALLHLCRVEAHTMEEFLDC